MTGTRPRRVSAADQSTLLGRDGWLLMKYMTDAHLSGLARELREQGVDCDTVHKLLLGNEDSRVKISDPEIVRFLSNMRGGLTLITLDNELAEYCENFGIPCIRVQDLVTRHIASSERVK